MLIIPIYAKVSNIKYRIVIDFIVFDDEIILIDIGSHDNAYRA
ncbi:hypothetical protein SPBRAN_1757 [uncultured Candidatus Thioglobus sp.]|nr:hypothetical protein SPBRAN_1757 [uncultured Candidatus Thioglobus sp.]